MNIAHLYEFVTTAKHMKLTSAAQELYVSPSTLSQHISSMERELGAPLFDRQGSLTLTREGEAAFHHFQKIIQEYELLKQKCSRSDGQDIELRVPNYFFGLDVYIVAKTAFEEVHPECAVQLRTYEYQLKDPIEILQKDLCDVAALNIIEGSGDDIRDFLPEGFDWILIGSAQHKAVTSSDHPLAKKGTLDLEDFRGQTLVTTSCRLSEISVVGLKKKMRSDGVDVSVLYHPVNRHEDIFATDLDKGIFVVADSWKELRHFADFPHLVTHDLSFDLAIDTYLIYRPNVLGDLQRSFLDILRQTVR